MNAEESDVDNRDGRVESAIERYDRNWNELLQEFRVLQTGTQILAGFLLTLPFQQRFTELRPIDHVLYLVLVVLATLITIAALAPVTMHRLLFRQEAKRQLVEASHIVLILCLAAASLLFVGIVGFVFAFVVTPAAGLWAGGVVAAVALGIWTVLPPILRAEKDRARARV